MINKLQGKSEVILNDVTVHSLVSCSQKSHLIAGWSIHCGHESARKFIWQTVPINTVHILTPLLPPKYLFTIFSLFNMSC